MADLGAVGRVLLVAGLALAGLGLLIMLAGRIPFLGRLPGDIAVQRDGASFYFPIVTSLLLSLLLTVVLNVVLNLWRR
jgi:hypothetical protein